MSIRNHREIGSGRPAQPPSIPPRGGEVLDYSPLAEVRAGLVDCPPSIPPTGGEALVLPPVGGVRGGLLLGLIFLALIVSTITSVQAQGPEQPADPHQAGLVIVHGDGTVSSQCVTFPEDEITGMELLERSDLDMNLEVGGLMGVTVCGLDGEGCAYPAADCFCRCQGSPCIFWQYWHWQAGNWSFSQLGAANYTVRPGDMQSWVWAEGSPGGGGITPPALTFDQICPLPPTDTPLPLPSQAVEPTATPIERPPTVSATSPATPTTSNTLARPAGPVALAQAEGRTEAAMPTSAQQPAPGPSIWPTLLNGLGLVSGLVLVLGLLGVGGVWFFRYWK